MGRGYPCTPFRRGRVFSPSRPPLGERSTRIRGGREKGAPLRELPLAYARDLTPSPARGLGQMACVYTYAVCCTLIIARSVWNVKRVFQKSQYLSSGLGEFGGRRGARGQTAAMVEIAAIRCSPARPAQMFATKCSFCANGYGRKVSAPRASRPWYYGAPALSPRIHKTRHFV